MDNIIELKPKTRQPADFAVRPAAKYLDDDGHPVYMIVEKDDQGGVNVTEFVGEDFLIQATASKQAQVIPLRNKND